jgi:translation initiation factor 2 subunit 1
VSVEVATLPETWELVVATAGRIVPYGAYVNLDEYNNVEGLLHISEISSRWVKNIKDHVREGDKIVLKVLRVDPVKLHIDLSLRRVSERERRAKLLQWKQENRGRKLLDMAAERMGVSSEEAYEKIGMPLEEHFGSIYLGLEKAVEEGESALVKSGIPAEWATVLTKLVKGKIRAPQVKISGILELKSSRPDGVSVLRKAFAKAKGLKKPNNADIRIYVTGTPKYRIEVTAGSYKVAESLLDRVVKNSITTLTASGGEGRFIRTP